MNDTLLRPFYIAAAVVAIACAACAGQSPATIPSAYQSVPAARTQARIPKPAPTSTVFTSGITPSSNPRGIALGPFATTMWFTQPGSGQIGRITNGGVVKEFTATTNAVNNVVTGPDGNIWFTQGGYDGIGRMTQRGKVTIFATGNEAYGPFDICNGPDGNLWFTFRSPSTNAIGRITPSGSVTLFTSGLSPGDVAVHDIVEGSDGNLWFTEEFGNRVGRITTAGVITEFSNGISQQAGVSDITAGPDGNLWFSENSANKIGRINTAGIVTEFSQGISPQAGPGSMASAKGYVWFTEVGGSRLGRVNTSSGTITEYPIPVVLASDIAAAPNGSLWITDYNGNAVVKFTL